MSIDPTPVAFFIGSEDDREQFFAGRRWPRVWKQWLAAVPDPFRTYINRLERGIHAEQGRTSQAMLRANLAERRERDAAVSITQLKRRIAELESRP